MGNDHRNGDRIIIGPAWFVGLTSFDTLPPAPYCGKVVHAGSAGLFVERNNIQHLVTLSMVEIILISRRMRKQHHQDL